MKERPIDPEKAMKQILRIFKKRGAKALREAEKEILSEKIESPEVREALEYFMKNYWRDTTRPGLLSLVCETVGGKAEATTPFAVSAILTSGGADIHDDIIDESKNKEVGPTVYGKFGRDIALLAGDALLFKGLALLFQAAEGNIPLAKFSDILDITKRTFFELGDAEALELHLRKRIDLTPDEYIHVLEKKAAIVEGYAQIGAILGGASEKEITNFGKYGRVLGMLIMLRDDLIDMIDVEELMHRIKGESLPLPIIYAVQNPKTKSALAPHLFKKTVAKEDAELTVRITKDAGGMRRCQELMEKLAADAHNNLKGIKTNKQYLTLLIQALISL